jgi:hypothetical protein
MGIDRAMVPIRVDPLLLLVAGLVIDALFGDMPVIFRHIDHPVVVAAHRVFDHKPITKTAAKLAPRSRDRQDRAGRRCGGSWSRDRRFAAVICRCRQL